MDKQYVPTVEDEMRVLDTAFALFRALPLKLRHLLSCEFCDWLQRTQSERDKKCTDAKS